MIYFDAREAFASLLSCPLLNRDEKYLFDLPEKDPFTGPPKSSIIGDINTGQRYQKTHKALVKNPDVNMTLTIEDIRCHLWAVTVPTLFHPVDNPILLQITCAVQGTLPCQNTVNGFFK
jgi:hypothetical protein